MADIEVRCSSCGKTATVSEFALRQALNCPACGEKLSQTSAASPQKAKRSPRIRTEPAKLAEAEPADGAEEEHAQPEWRFNTQIQDMRSQPDSKRKINPALLPWLLFSLLAVAMYFLQHHAIPALEYEDYRATASPIIYMGFHILITLRAFKDSVFHGVLCFLLPPYTLYYLFLASDDFYLRAVFGATLFVIGKDTAFFFQEAWISFYNAANHFIQGGALQ